MNDQRVDQRAEQRAVDIENRIDKTIAGDIIVSRVAGGVDIRRLGEMMEVAKFMAVSGSMVPAYLRNNPGACFAICWKALGWGMDPFGVAQMSYEVENGRTKEKTVAFMSQLIHAVIEARAPIRKRLAVAYEGEGDDRVCIVSGVFRGEDEPRVWRSPRLGDRKPKARSRTNQQTGETYETTTGSPLWFSKPDQQQFYDTSRDWARVYCPDILLGVYTKEELEDNGFQPVNVGGYRTAEEDVGLTNRLTQSALERTGFAPTPETTLTVDHVHAEVEGALAARGSSPGRTDGPEAAPGGEGQDGEPEPATGRQRRSRRQAAGGAE